jgi:hypothetical protein
MALAIEEAYLSAHTERITGLSGRQKRTKEMPELLPRVFIQADTSFWLRTNVCFGIRKCLRECKPFSEKEFLRLSSGPLCVRELHLPTDKILLF